MLRKLLPPLLFIIAIGSQAAPPPGYYDSVDASTPLALRTTLHSVIDDHTRFPYTATGTDTWDILEQADRDPNNASNIIDVYRNASYPAAGGGNPDYNREHSWPTSHGFPNDNSSNYPYTDCHHLYLCDDGYNSARSNKPYRTCNATCDELPTDVNDGRGGGSGVYPGNSNWESGFTETGSWETWIGRRGDVARSLFYMDVRYEGGTHGITEDDEPDLILTDNDTLIVADTENNRSVAHMGILSVLLEWHIQDPVDDQERGRNDIVFGFQGNRNPFIDHPEWVSILFGQAPPEPHVWINEFHYDNAGSDSGEFVEIAGTAGVDLTDWTVVGYNGGDGGVYKTVDLSGVLPNQQECIGTLDFAFSGMQNGAPDGLALVDVNGVVVQFLSYEGAIVATDGPASGMTSTDIGVSETSGTPEGHSLQLGGTGARLEDFTWQAELANTAGQQNTGQSFLGGCAQATPCGISLR